MFLAPHSIKNRNNQRNSNRHNLKPRITHTRYPIQLQQTVRYTKLKYLHTLCNRLKYLD